ncbi:hypothetical protein GCM10007897_16590 [Sphingobium jiangsuense]|uniref:DoxX family protein n=1 Tax=Sphingobium jiangsuense TaxID=870476 RepID=A0A7W6FRH4_9SPHN|nr:hypothetical protein [Sphingobium jiangsuense]MBB3927059.1 hypothetical protein [Sphingobium jiangsuense]GLT00275.1 hypothetical protein GCM10007897_16590 [Sphingobium jiangsuense]
MGAAHQGGGGGFLARSELAVRWLLGIQCLLSGINWWYKILPFPNMFDPPGLPVKAEVVRAMLDSGWMFTAAKAVEVALGLSLLFNRYVPLMLVVSFPVIFLTFMLDANFLPALGGYWHGDAPFQHLAAKVLDMLYFGGACLAMQVFLMLSHFDRYRPMLIARAAPMDWSRP